MVQVHIACLYALLLTYHDSTIFLPRQVRLTSSHVSVTLHVIVQTRQFLLTRQDQREPVDLLIIHVWQE